MRSRYIEEGDLKALREVTKEEAFLPLALSLETGLRVGDIVGLKVSSVKPDGIHYTAQKTKKAELRKSLRSSAKAE